MPSTTAVMREARLLPVLDSLAKSFNLKLFTIAILLNILFQFVT